jgi:signal transduction histidine kinase
MEADLIIAKEKAEESDRLKSAFLANMSHEIRTPLNSIIGFSELLDDSSFDENQKREFIQHISTNGNNLLNIISDIMDISKIESGEITIRPRKINVQELLENVKSSNWLRASEKQLEFRFNSDGAGSAAEVNVSADLDRLHQIFNNLIGNALKFTSKGYIEIGFQPKDSEIEFFVKDTGVGIDSEFHERIFERFRQVELPTVRKYGGNGLGLTITKNLIGLMQGKIWLESEPGKGSTFYFSLPKWK